MMATRDSMAIKSPENNGCVRIPLEDAARLESQNCQGRGYYGWFAVQARVRDGFTEQERSRLRDHRGNDCDRSRK